MAFKESCYIKNLRVDLDTGQEIVYIVYLF